jgi:hypothetical protein
LPAAEREPLAQRYAERAVAVLQKLDAKGHFRDIGNWWALNAAPVLDPLRGRTDFQKLRDGIPNPLRGLFGKPTPNEMPQKQPPAR